MEIGADASRPTGVGLAWDEATRVEGQARARGGVITSVIRKGGGTRLRLDRNAGGGMVYDAELVKYFLGPLRD